MSSLLVISFLNELELICLHISIAIASTHKLVIVVEDDEKAPFSIATTEV